MMVGDPITPTGVRTPGVRPGGPNDGVVRRAPSRLRTGSKVSLSPGAKDGSKPEIDLCTLGASLSREDEGKAPSEMSALKPYPGKRAVRNFREGDGDNGIIRSPFSAITLLGKTILPH